MIKEHSPKKASMAYNHGRTGARRCVDQMTSIPAHTGSAGSTYAMIPHRPKQSLRRPSKMLPDSPISTAMKISIPSAIRTSPAIYRIAIASAEYAGACLLLPLPF